jgi:hypothetical protein
VLTTGRQVVERIQKNLGIPWNNKTYRDTFKAGTDDPLYKLKVEFVEKNNMIIWRFHAHWHAQQIPGYRRKRTSSIQRLQSSNYKCRAVSLRTPRRQRSAKGCTKLDSFRAFPGGLRAAAENRATVPLTRVREQEQVVGVTRRPRQTRNLSGP